MLRTCPDATCHGALVWISCEARMYHFVVEEDGSQYSVWEHTGSHRSHPRPPSGRRPPHSVPPPPRINTKPLANPHPNPRIVQTAVHKSREHRRDADLSTKSKIAASVGIAVHEREGSTSQVVDCNGCGEVHDECEGKGVPSNLAWSCANCRGAVVWRDDR